MLDRLSELDSEEEIKQLIHKALSVFGGVESIHVFEPSTGNPQRIALATMASMELAGQASSSLGLRAFGHKSLIIPLARAKD